MSDNDDLTCYQHTPGNPVLDRLAALLSVRRQGRPGNAIASLDTAALADTGQLVTVMSVDHATGRVTVWHGTEGQRTVAGTDLVVTQPAHFPPVPDNRLEDMTVEDARAEMVPVASDNGRYPQYHARYFAGWVFGRARRNIKLRGEVILVKGQRCLVRPGGSEVTAWITRTTGTRRVGRAVGLFAYQIELEPRDYATVVADTLNANQNI